MPPRLVSALGILVLLGLLYACSKHRKKISWRLVGTGLLFQLLLGGVLLSWESGREGLYAFGEGVKGFLELSSEGTLFMFGPLADFQLIDGAFKANEGTAPDGRSYDAVREAFSAGGRRDLGFVFATQVLPTLIFFSAFMGVLYHLGVMQKAVQGMAWVMARVMKTSGSESLSCCGNIFVGQTEAPLMVRPFLPRMTQSELHAVMCGGFCTIAGGVFALYVLFGVPAGHLVVASVMAVPAGLVCSKMLFPETEESETYGKVVQTPRSEAGTVVEAAANGASDGLKLALNVGAMLIAFLGLVAVINWLLGLASGDYLTLEKLLGWVFYPLAAVMGVPGGEISLLAELLGKKIVLTELIAYKDLGPMIKAGEVSERTALVASFALCGFANLGSLAIQIGGLAVMAPERKADIARLATRAMCAGALATCMTACFAGLLG